MENKVDDEINRMFERLFLLAETTQIGDRKSAFRREVSTCETVEGNESDIKSDGEMQAVFNRMISGVDKLVKKAVEHNRRLPDALMTTKISRAELSTSGQNLKFEELELYERTKTVGPLKRFAEDFRKVAEEKKKFKQRGGKKRQAKLLAKRFRELNARMGTDEYCNSLTEAAVRESNFLKRKRSIKSVVG